MVYRQEDKTEYADAMEEAYRKADDGKPRKNPSDYYKAKWRTYQLSDHLPMWVEINIDHTDSYLASKLVPSQVEDESTDSPVKSADESVTKKPSTSKGKSK